MNRHITELALYDSTVHYYVRVYEMGLCTYQEMLEKLVLHLAKEKVMYSNAVQRAAELSTGPFTIPSAALGETILTINGKKIDHKIAPDGTVLIEQDAIDKSFTMSAEWTAARVPRDNNCPLCHSEIRPSEQGYRCGCSQWRFSFRKNLVGRQIKIAERRLLNKDESHGNHAS